MRLSRNDLIVLIVLILLSIGFGWLTYRHFTRGIEVSADARSLGQVYYKYNEVYRKYSGRLVWEVIKPNTLIYQHDSFLTKDKSDATLIFDKGARIDLLARSMIQIELFGDEVGLDLNRGIVQAMTSENGGTTKIKTSSGMIVEVGEGSATLQDTGEGLQIFVTSGQVFVESQDGKKITVAEGKVLKVNKNGSIESKSLAIVGMQPKNNSIYLTKKNKETLDFSWKPLQDTETTEPYVFKASRYGDMRDALVIKTKGQNTKVTLGTGNWFWNVSSGEKVSSLGTITLQKEEEIKVFAPSPSPSTVLKKKETEPVIFEWEKQDKNQNSYELIIAEDEKMKKVVSKKIVHGNTVMATNLKQGKYYWTVDPHYGKKEVIKDKNSQKRKVYSFLITGEGDFTPSRLSPNIDQGGLLITAGQKRNILFQWNGEGETEVRVYEGTLEGDKKKLLKKERTTRNQLNFTAPWNINHLIWEVEPIVSGSLSGNIQQAEVTINLRVPPPPVILDVIVQ